MTTNAAAPGEGTTAAAPAEGADASAPEPAARPDAVPEKFWDTEKNVVNFDAWSESTKALEGKLRTRTDDLRKQVEDEYTAERLKGRPESADKYELRVPESIKLPEGMEFQFNDGDPMVGFWREFCYDQGLGQEGFDQGVEAYINGSLSQMPDMEAEFKALGDHGMARAARVNTWLEGTIGKENVAALEGATTTAKSIEALEILMEKTGEPAFSAEAAAANGTDRMSIDELRKMQSDPRYWNDAQRDPAFVAKVDNMFKQLFN